LRGTVGNRDAIGAHVELWVAGRRLVRERTSGGGYLASHDPRLYFGLGGAGEIDSVRVNWPGGGQTTLTHPSVDTLLVIEQPDG
jgi:enediyne biosynthesis protein E4